MTDTPAGAIGPATLRADGTGAPLLETRGLTHRFGELRVVCDVNLAIARGELRAIIGPNGAGKTTLLKLLSGELRPTSGRILFKGRDITGWPMHRVARLGIVRSFQITHLFPQLSVLENVRVAVQARHSTYNFWRRAEALPGVVERARALLEEVDLLPKAALPAGVLSHGEQRHLELAVALAAEPELLLLDEPTAGMSVEDTQATARLIRRLAERLTIVLVEHKMDVVMNIAQRIVVLHFGEVLAEGTPAEIRANEAVQDVYLGRGRAAGAGA
jgi:branched-chain amino acid transport system ATP-binding protein